MGFQKEGTRYLYLRFFVAYEPEVYPATVPIAAPHGCPKSGDPYLYVRYFVSHLPAVYPATVL
eukprot:1579103-Pyramimonas_sp.AAC.1